MEAKGSDLWFGFQVTIRVRVNVRVKLWFTFIKKSTYLKSNFRSLARLAWLFKCFVFLLFNYFPPKKVNLFISIILLTFYFEGLHV